MTTTRAPKQWPLTKTETITSFEAWRQNLQYTLSLDTNFAPFLVDGFTWLKKTPATPLRGFENDGQEVADNIRRTAAQKVTHLELMLGQIANFCPVVSRNTIVKNSTSVLSIWQSIRQHYGFQSTGSHFLDFDNIHLEAGERPEDLYQRLMSFIEDNLLTPNGNISHHGEIPDAEEELSPTLENLVILTWLRLIHKDLPALVKQRYGTELRSKTLASIKPEISQALDSLLDEIHTSHESKVLRTAFVKQTKTANKKSLTTTLKRECPLCKQAGRARVDHFLSMCKYLPEGDKRFMNKSRRLVQVEDSDSDESSVDICDPSSIEDEDPPSFTPSTRRVSTTKSAQIKAFYEHHPVYLTIDSGAEISMIRTKFAELIGASIKKTSQNALQADGMTPLDSVGEVHLTLSRDNKILHLDALAVNDLDVDILAGMPFMKCNDIGIRPSKNQVTIGDSTVIQYIPDDQSTTPQHVRRAQAFILRSSPTTTTVWPGSYMELKIPDALHPESTLSLEPRVDRTTTGILDWPKPTVIEAVGGKIRLLNDTDEPCLIHKNDHLCQIHLTSTNYTDLNGSTHYEVIPSSTTVRKTGSSNLHSDTVSVDPDKILSKPDHEKFKELLTKYDSVFDPKYRGYNGTAGKFECHINMGPVQPPQRKGRLPQYSRDKLQELQQKCDELETLGVLKKPEELDVSVEYLNPSFLVKKPNGGYRLVTAFEDVGRYSKPQPSLMPDIDSTLRTIGRWKYIIVSDLTSAFHQIPLSKPSLKYCGIVTPYRGIRVYTRCAMGMPGSETALEELMCRILGDCLQEGYVAKLADDLYCGGQTVEELLTNWECVLESLAQNGLHLSPTKTIICPRSTTILGWNWTEGKISASRHKVSTLSSCSVPDTVKGLRSFLGAYKILGRVIPNCSDILTPLENSIGGMQSKDKVQWTDELRQHFKKAQEKLSMNKTIVLPTPSDELWIVTDGSVSKRGLGATMYAMREGKLNLAGFFSAKLRKHQVTWLPCEIEALCIAAAVKHFSPFIIQSQKQTHVLTDSKPCVEAFEKLRRGEFSSSPRVTSFLSVASRYRTSIQHLAGSANVPSDFASRNAPECSEPRCQICNFIAQTEDSVVRSVCLQDVLDSKVNLAFTTRSAWMSIQSECPDLRRTHAHLKQGTRPSRKLTNIKDVKRYLSVASIARDGLLVVRRSNPFQPTTEMIIVPRSVLEGLITALHVSLDHPTRNQMQLVMKRHFYALDLVKAIENVCETCHVCASLKKFPDQFVPQSSEEPTETFGIMFAADVLKRNCQLVLVLRECVTSYTVACLIPDEKRDTLREAILRLALELRPLDGPPSVIRVDPAPGFVGLREDDTLTKYRITIEVGRVKNKNKNPVAEKAIGELEEELLRQEPGGGPVTDLKLSIAVARLNSRIRFTGLSARELWTQRSQYTNEQIPVSDLYTINSKQTLRENNHSSSAVSKWKSNKTQHQQPLQVGNLVYLYCDRDKNKARNRYLITAIDGEWCYIKKFSGRQIRANSYKVKLAECYSVPCEISQPTLLPKHQYDDTEEQEDHPDSFEQCHDTNQIDSQEQRAIPPLLTVPPSNDYEPTECTIENPTPEDQTEEIAPQQSEPLSQRPVRDRRLPKYLQDYVIS